IFAGLAGSIHTLGYEGKLLADFSPAWGFGAIAIAIIGRMKTGGIVVTSLFFGAMDTGAAGLLTMGASSGTYITQVVEGVAAVYLLVSIELLRKRRSRRRKLD